MVSHFFGIGFYTKSNCEVCLLATKGKPSNLKISNYVSSCIISERREHSRKPDEARETLKTMKENIDKKYLKTKNSLAIETVLNLLEKKNEEIEKYKTLLAQSTAKRVITSLKDSEKSKEDLKIKVV